LRIPPSPLVSGDAFNEALLSALDGHPQAPKDLTTTLRATGERLLKLRTEIKRWLSGGHIDLSKPAIKSLLQHTQARFASSIEDYREGDAVVEYGLSDKEFIKLRTELHGGRLMFDFSGTSPGRDIFLTSSGAFGICVGAVLSCLP